ncbi:MAG TPA: ATP-binding protein [Frankiaceae bacterium]|nr:ATP-binding protein [Frankiaceae bacterium]
MVGASLGWSHVSRTAAAPALQALALLARDATRGMPAEQVAALAHEQEAALRQLLLRGPSGGSRAGNPSGSTSTRTTDLAAAVGEVIAATLPPTRSSYSRSAGALRLPEHVVRETAAAVRATLDNVVRHAGPAAQVFVLLEDDVDAVLVTIRDDGAGMDPDRPNRAGTEGRIGLARSVRGRIEDLGGTVTVTTARGQGTEVELRVPR